MNRDELPRAIADYFTHLENNDFESAAEQFTEDCVYYHPPSYQDSIKVEGREELLEYFAAVRGPQDIDHILEKLVVYEDKIGFIGHQTGGDTGDDYFISYAELEDGKISYYMAGFLIGSTVRE
jgi:ketosteroid isomerase-like protein